MFFKKYDNHLIELLSTTCISSDREKLLEVINTTDQLAVFGNGGSSSIASHVAEDFTKVARIPMSTYTDHPLISCYANDYGWDNSICKIIEHYQLSQGLIIFISSSGESTNIVNGAVQAKKQGNKIATFTGFLENNSLKTIGDINFHVASNKYNIIETIHSYWLLAMCDYLAQQKG